MYFFIICTLSTIALLLIFFIYRYSLYFLFECNFELSPYPNGKDFAFSIIDDTDYCYGCEIVPIYDILHELGFKTTKTVWVFDQKFNNCFRTEGERLDSSEGWGLSLENESYLNYIKGLHKKGFEIALHGVSAGNDYRKYIINGYSRFKEIFGHYPRIDVLHAQNIENLYCGRYKFDFWPLKIMERLVHNSNYQGHIPDSNYFWGDIAQEYVDYIRLPFHEIKEINLLKINPTFPFHDPRRPYVNYWFTNSDGANYIKFMDLTKRKNMDRLNKEKGTTIIYTHFANGFSFNNGVKYIAKENFIKRMHEIKSLNGWFVTSSEILDRFIQMRNMRLIEEYDKIILVNTGNKTIENLTIISKHDDKFIDSDQNIYKANKDGKIIIGSISHNSSKILWKIESRNARNFQPNEKISKLEHIRIELFNYFGGFF